MKVLIQSSNSAIIETVDSTFLQSYAVIVAAKIQGKFYLDKKWSFYSKTTSKHQSQFFGLNSKEQKNGLKDGTIKLLDLNTNFNF